MKRYTLFTAIFLVGLLSFHDLAAQKVVPQTHTVIGVKGGLNLASVYGDDASFSEDGIEFEPGFRMGFNAGAFAEIPFSPQFGLEVGLFFTQQGAKYDESVTNTIEGQEVVFDFESNLNLNYLSVPILAEFYIPLNSTGNFQIFAGPEIFYFLSGDQDYDLVAKSNGQEVYSESEGSDIDSDDANTITVNITGGVGFNFQAGNGVFSLDVRYLMGLMNAPDSDADGEIKNNGFQFRVGYGFFLN